MRGAPQQTLKKSVEFSGVGLHTGQDCRIVVNPLSENAGIVFRRADSEAAGQGARRRSLIKAAPENVVRADHGTVLANAYGVTVKTVEHLMAAFALVAVDNALIDVFGPEIPILDGSADAFVSALRKAGLVAQSAPRQEIVLDETVRVGDGDRIVILEPADAFSLDISIAFEECVIGRQSLRLTMRDLRECDRLATARTFCQLHEVETLRNAGLGRGGSLKNAIVIDGDRLLEDQTLRDPQEFVLHKALDFVGDLYLLGAPVRAKIRAEKPGHTLNTRAALAVSRLLEGRQDAFRDQAALA